MTNTNEERKNPVTPTRSTLGNPNNPELHDFAEWGNNGLLWLINSTVFWPRGYSLSLSGSPDPTDGNKITHALGYSILGNGTEIRVPSSEARAQSKFEDVQALFASLEKNGEQA